MKYVFHLQTGYEVGCVLCYVYVCLIGNFRMLGLAKTSSFLCCDILDCCKHSSGEDNGRIVHSCFEAYILCVREGRI